MDPGWAALIGAAIGSTVTGGLVLLRDHFEARRRRTAEALAAAEAVLVESMSVVQLANGLRLTVQIRSGLNEGLNIALRHRKLLEPLDLADRFAVALHPLFAAQTTIWAKGSREMISLVNEVVFRCFDLVQVATEPGRGGSAASRYVRGEQWTDEQVRDYEEAAKKVGDARRALAIQLREESDSPAVDDPLGSGVT